MGRLDGKVAIITGGAMGFGRGACELWAKEGAKILTCDVKVAEGEAVAKEIRSNGGEIVFIPADVSKTEDAKRIVPKTIDTYGALDILYNNAGILGPRGVEVADFTEEDARRLWEINFMGVFLPTKFALPEMVKRGGGSIISTGSESAFRGNGGFCVYGPTKIAVMNFSMVTAMEYAERGIRSNTVSPGAARTPMHNDLYDGKSDLMERVEAMIPLKRAAMPDDVAKAALFYASDDSKYITGTNLVVDGGWLAKATSEPEGLGRGVSSASQRFSSSSDKGWVKASMPTGTLEAAESPALSLLSMSKSFGPTKALQNVDLLLRRGEVVALLGANGAGKSTLAKIASGVVEPNHGQISINGRPVRFSVFLNRASWPLRACFAAPRERQAISSPESRERQFRLRGLPAGA